MNLMWNLINHDDKSSDKQHERYWLRYGRIKTIKKRVYVTKDNGEIEKIPG